ncbi:hypothetical protein ACH5RR_023174 [Cinchona calisaya]|uniref:SHSP domain-containing protein n=1 Tax=Cinchona calisaya TaxID=153742 RepID=A0ABD2ZDT4_9GENT
MATRPLRGAEATPSRPWAGVQPVYEDFRPMSEWQRDKESDILLLFLPGFMRQHLKVSTEDNNIVRVRGERFVAENKWSRFQEDYKVPEICNISAIRARFEGEILTITIPWKKDNRPQLVGSKEVAKAAPPVEIPQKTTSSSPETQKQKLSPPKPSFGQRPQKDANDIHQKVVKDVGDIHSKELNPPPVTTDKGEDEKIFTQPQAQKGQEKERDRTKGHEPKPVISMTSVNDGTTESKEMISSQTNAQPMKSKIIGKLIEGTDDKKSSIVQRKEGIADPAQNITRRTGNEKVTSEKIENKGEYTGQKEKQTTRTVAPSSSSIDYGLENYKAAVKSIVELNEERQLLVNIGVAVLVIVALGTYISYRVASSDA